MDAWTNGVCMCDSYELEHARAVALVTLTTASAGITVALSRLRSVAARIMVLGTLSLSLLLVQMPSAAALLHLKPLHLADWTLAMGGGLLASLLALASVRTGAARPDRA